jgi:Glyoxalase-like domain
MASLGDIVVDSAHPASIARFWAAALDDYAVAPYDDAELARLRVLGIDDVEDDPSVLLMPRSPDRPRIWFQRVPEAKSVKNRVHLDLRCADIALEAGRLIDLGARVIAVREELTVLADPEGNEFCLIR